MRRARGSAERPTIAATLSVVLVACAAATPMRLTALAFLAAAPLRLASARAAANAAAAPGVCAAAAGARCAAPPTMAAAAAPAAITGPAWDLGDEYASLSAPELAADLAAAKEDVKAMAGAGAVVAGALERARDMSLEEVEAEGVLAALEEMNRLGWSAGTLLRNVATFASCVGSVDGGNEAAKRLGAEMGELFAARAQAAAPADLFLQLCPGEVAEAYLGRSAETGENRFLVGERRKMRAHALSLAEENMLSAYAVPGHHAWGDLYTDLSASLAVKVEGTGSMGVAAAAGLLDSGDAAVRRAAWLGIKAAWLPHAETSAAILNALAKWRLDTYARRGLPDFLAAPLHQNRLTRPSLDAMMAAIDGEGVRVGRRALAVQAAALGRADGKLEPWDLMAPAPVAGRGTTYPFEDGVEVIAAAVGAVDVKAGEFVRMMRDKRWIEATRGDSKRPGAYCTGFAKSRNPRVYLSEYNGRAPLLLTLAHELGHAYHSWVMRDLPRAQTSYPMCLAETASIFFETVVAADLLARAETPEEKFAISYNNAKSAGVFLLNIPARYKFEFDLYTKRSDGKLSKAEVDALMVDAWKHYYGDSMSRLDEVGIFSASKLHFSLSSLSFYNWPYSFGQLFALSVYAARERLGAGFADMYTGLLRDTGRHTAEEVVEKWLDGKITRKDFWEGGVALVRKQVSEFERFAGELGHRVQG